MDKSKEINKKLCLRLLKLNAEPIARFKARIAELWRTAEDTVIMLINVDDVNGAELADLTMPGHDWQQYRNQGLLPVARGIQDKALMEKVLDVFDTDAAEKLRSNSQLMVVVVDCGVAEIFNA